MNRLHMVEWGRVDGGIAAAGAAGRVTVTAPDWAPAAPACPLPFPVDVAVPGRASTLTVPGGSATLAGANGVAFPVDDDHRVAGEYLLTVEAPVETLVRFDGEGSVRQSEAGVRVDLDGRAPVALGFRDPPPDPETISVPPTPAGLAAAVTEMGAALADLGPERSRPSRRPHPPLVEYDEGAEIPDHDRPLVFQVPDTLEDVLVAAPLAYYLGAALVAEPRDAPLLSVPSVGFERPYGATPAFAHEVATDFRRVFHLDCLAREPAFSGELDRSTLAQLGLDADSVREVSPGVRYSTYLDAPTGDAAVPRWHLSTYVTPTYEHARSLPQLLDRLSLVYPAEASEMEPRELLERSLDDFYRGDVVSVSPVAPELGAGDSHAWLAGGEPVDAFKTSTRAHEHRLAASARDREALTVELVVNDPEMIAESSVAETYRSAPVPVSVAVSESLSTAELARAFERDVDFLHFVGHCEVDGLQCPDGALAASSLASSGATTFFLNACGSYREGETLVENGSVAGGVTMDRVLNEQATRVGTAFGRLLVHGLGIDRALSLARRRIMMGRDYAVVGDGTFALAPTPGRASVIEAERLEEGFAVEHAVATTRDAGASYRDPVDGCRRLYGTRTTARMDATGLARLLDERHVPVVCDGDLRWAGDVRAELGTPDPAHGP